jgi:uncharacterized protein YoxC
MTNEVELIDLNQADVGTLSTLPGIGQALAERIVEFRETVHPFEEVIELTAVTGISERTVRNFENLVTVTIPTRTDEMETETGGVEEDTVELMVEEVAPEVATEPVPASEPKREEEAEPGEDSPEDMRVAESREEAAGETEISLAEADAEMVTEEPGHVSPESEAVETDEGVEPQPFAPHGLEGAAPPPSPVADRDRQAQRRGCIVLLLGTILGAIAGTALTLAILATLNNGGLSFTQADSRLRSDLDDVNQARESLTNQLNSLEAQLAALATRTDELTQQQAEADSSLSDVQRAITRIQTDIAQLDETADQLDERITTVAAAAETFNTFLDGMRDLLFKLQGPPPTPVPTATATMATETPEVTLTATPETPEAVTPAGSPPSTGQPTRTPRPTATPFALPTSTPEPQP